MKTTRRDFVKSAGAGALAATLVPAARPTQGSSNCRSVSAVARNSSACPLVRIVSARSGDCPPRAK